MLYILQLGIPNTLRSRECLENLLPGWKIDREGLHLGSTHVSLREQSETSWLWLQFLLLLLLLSSVLMLVVDVSAPAQHRKLAMIVL